MRFKSIFQERPGQEGSIEQTIHTCFQQTKCTIDTQLKDRFGKSGEGLCGDAEEGRTNARPDREYNSVSLLETTGGLVWLDAHVDTHAHTHTHKRTQAYTLTHTPTYTCARVFAYACVQKSVSFIA